jgi:elongation of very long chain fatty acids protein 4
MTWLNDWLIEHVSSYKLALKYVDPRTKDWFLLWGDPIPTLTLTIIYLLIVIIGSHYMKQRKAFDIPIIILFSYNMSLVLLSVYLVEEVILLRDKSFIN